MSFKTIVFDPKNPTHSNYISSIATLHATCITTDKTILTFLPPLSHPKIVNWWTDLAKQTAGDSPERFIILCLVFKDGSSSVDDNVENRDGDGDGDGDEEGEEEVAGVVMLHSSFSETGSFRGSVEKLIVSPDHRNRRVGSRLMRRLEAVARERGKTILVSS